MPSSLEVRRTMLEDVLCQFSSTVNDANIVANAAIGRIFYVNNAATNKNDTTGGRSWHQPMSTIAAAIALCVAARGDIIKCGPGHAETISAAAGIAMATAGVTLMGVGVGTNRPTLTWATSTAATLTVTAANCRITNFVFDMSLPSALVSGMVVSGAGCEIDNCLFKIGTAGTGTRPLQAILTTAGANYLNIHDNEFLEPALTPTTVSAASCAVKIVGGTGLKIVRNFFCGWYTLSIGAINGITTLTDNIRITDNTIINQTASATKGIVLLTGSTGAVNRNIFGIASGAAPITGDAVWWGGNWSSAAVAANGTLV